MIRTYRSKDQNVSSPSLFRALPLAERFRNPTQHRTHSVNHHGRDYDADLREPGDRCELIFWISLVGRFGRGDRENVPFRRTHVEQGPSVTRVRSAELVRAQRACFVVRCINKAKLSPTSPLLSFQANRSC